MITEERLQEFFSDITPQGLLVGFDFDGTIAPYEGLVDWSRPHPLAHKGIKRMAKDGVQVVALSGRRVSFLQKVFAKTNRQGEFRPCRIDLWGRYGTERIAPGATSASRAPVQLASALARLQDELSRRASFGIRSVDIHHEAGLGLQWHDGAYADSHFRDRLEQIINELFFPGGYGGGYGYAQLISDETRDQILMYLEHKGIALETRLAEDPEITHAVFLGDDVPDVDAFDVLQRQNEERGLKVLKVFVRSNASTPDLIEAAEEDENCLILNGEAQAGQFLLRMSEIVRQLTQRAQPQVGLAD